MMSAEDTNIVEGPSVRLTVSASRPVSADTEVMMVREAVEDGTAEEGEVLTLFAVVDGVQMPNLSVSFHLGDAPVPEPPTFSLSAEDTNIVEGPSSG